MFTETWMNFYTIKAGEQQVFTVIKKKNVFFKNCKDYAIQIWIFFNLKKMLALSSHVVTLFFSSGIRLLVRQKSTLILAILVYGNKAAKNIFDK